MLYCFVSRLFADLAFRFGEINSSDDFYTISNAECADGKHTVMVDTSFKITDKKKKEQSHLLPN